MKFHDLLDNTKCYEQIRQYRWPDGVSCPHCMSQLVTKQGKDDTQPERQRYRCSNCERRFDNLTLSVFSGYHQPGVFQDSCHHFLIFKRPAYAPAQAYLGLASLPWYVPIF